MSDKDEQLAAAVAAGSAFLFEDWDGPPVPVLFSAPDNVSSAVRLPTLSPLPVHPAGYMTLTACPTLRQAEVIVVIHGNGRNAPGYHRTWAELCAGHDVVVLTPYFSKAHYPHSSQFQCGNVMTFGDGDGEAMDGAATRENPRSEWTFSVVDGCFDWARRRYGLAASGFSLYGHSAGSQFLHRYLYWCPESPVKVAVAANAGWYTMPSLDVQWPYGLGGTRLGPDDLRGFVGRSNFVVLLGTGDVDTEDEGLRKSAEAEEQGPHRFARGQQFVATATAAAQQLGVACGVEQVLVPEATHSNALMAEDALQAILTRLPRASL